MSSLSYVFCINLLELVLTVTSVIKSRWAPVDDMLSCFFKPRVLPEMLILALRSWPSFQWQEPHSPDANVLPVLEVELCSNWCHMGDILGGGWVHFGCSCNRSLIWFFYEFQRMAESDGCSGVPDRLSWLDVVEFLFCGGVISITTKLSFELRVKSIIPGYNFWHLEILNCVSHPCLQVWPTALPVTKEPILCRPKEIHLLATHQVFFRVIYQLFS